MSHIAHNHMGHDHMGHGHAGHDHAALAADFRRRFRVSMILFRRRCSPLIVIPAIYAVVKGIGVAARPKYPFFAQFPA